MVGAGDPKELSSGLGDRMDGGISEPEGAAEEEPPAKEAPSFSGLRMS